MEEKPKENLVSAKVSPIKKNADYSQIVNILTKSREDYSAFDARVITPTYDPLRLYNLSLQNNILLQCITAMEVNIDGTGHEIMHRDEDQEGNSNAIKDLRGFFNEPYPNQSIVSIRRKLRVDMETVGYGFLEVIRDMSGNLALLNHVPAMDVRLLRLGMDTELEKVVHRNGEAVRVMVMGSERVFVRAGNLAADGRAFPAGPAYRKYYKEYGSTRRLNPDTGLWDDDADRDATELIMFKVHQDPESPYGLPRWINQIPSVLGGRDAEEFNLEFFDSGGLPPALVLLQGASLDDQTREQFLSFLSGKAKDKQRGLLVEMFSNSGDLDSTARSSVRVDTFGERQGDAMFLRYLEACSESIRVAFRLPDLYLGQNRQLTFATASVATMAAEAQVFKVERDEFDHMINTTVMKELNGDYLFQSNPVRLQDVDKQLRALDLAAKQTMVDRKSLLKEIGAVGNLTLDEDDASEMGFVPPGAQQVANPPNPEGAGTQDQNAPANTSATGMHET